MTVYIARRQAKTAKNKFRLDLLDRQFSIFEAVMRLAEAAVHKTKLTSDDVTQFEIAIRGARFFFNKSLEDYCKELRKEAVGIILDNRELERLPVGEERTKIAKRFEGRQLWFIYQLDKGIQQRFGPFLQIRG